MKKVSAENNLSLEDLTSTKKRLFTLLPDKQEYEVSVLVNDKNESARVISRQLLVRAKQVGEDKIDITAISEVLTVHSPIKHPRRTGPSKHRRVWNFL